MKHRGTTGEERREVDQVESEGEHQNRENPGELGECNSKFDKIHVGIEITNQQKTGIQNGHHSLVR